MTPGLIRTPRGPYRLLHLHVVGSGGIGTLYFDFGDYGVSGVPGTASNYVLLNRTSTTGTFAITAGTSITVSGDQVRFSLDGSNLATNRYYTIGSVDPALSPLPVELVSFSGVCAEGTILLKWATASEINNDFFTVDRSTDGKEWTAIATLKGAGTTRQTKHYAYRDDAFTQGMNYYRLR